MSGDHCRAERFAHLRAAIPPADVLDVLRHPEQAVDGDCRQYRRGRVAGEREALGDELNALTFSRLTLAGRSDRRATRRRISSRGRVAGRGLCGATGETGQHAEQAYDGATQSRSVPLRAVP